MKGRRVNPNSMAWLKNPDGFEYVPGYIPNTDVSTFDGSNWWVEHIDYQRKSDGKLCIYRFGFWSQEIASGLDVVLHRGGPGPPGAPTGPGWVYNFLVRPRLFDVLFV